METTYDYGPRTPTAILVPENHSSAGTFFRRERADEGEKSCIDFGKRFDPFCVAFMKIVTTVSIGCSDGVVD